MLLIVVLVVGPGPGGRGPDVDGGEPCCPAVVARKTPAVAAATSAAMPIIEGIPPKRARRRTQNQLCWLTASRMAASCAGGGGPADAP